MTTQAKADWFNVDVDTLTTEQQVAYAEYKDAQRKAAQLRETFEGMVTSTLPVPAGRKLVFGYRFGKLSAALVADDSKPKVVTQKGTLADFLQAQNAMGRRA